MTINDPLKPERLLINANIITLDPAQPRADWVVLGSGKILEVGDPGRLPFMDLPDVDIIDCQGMTILPGFIDAHCHVRAYAESFVSLHLTPGEGCLSIADIQKRISKFQRDLPAGTWIRGKGYHEFHLSEQRHPNRWDLDAVSPSHPVKLTHRSGLAHVLNSLALEIAGITTETGDPPGGLIDRDLETGMPTGLLYNMGKYLSRRIPPLDEADLAQGLIQANERLLACGITSVQDASAYNSLDQWRQFSKWKELGLIRSRVSMMLGVQGFSELDKKIFGSPVDETQLRPGGVKIILDETTGTLHPGLEKLEEQISAIHRSGFQAVIHAVDENVIEAACDVIDHVLKKHPAYGHRHRFEHCFVCPPHLASRMNDLGITVVTQPSFIYFHGDRYIKTVPGNQRQYLYPISTLLKNGLPVAAGSDFPITDPNPLVGIYAAVTRMSEGKKAVLEEEAIERYEALCMYTIGSAAANFEEDIKGSISPGKLADLVLLSEDPLTVDVEKIKDIEITMTIIGGNIVWSQI